MSAVIYNLLFPIVTWVTWQKTAKHRAVWIIIMMWDHWWHVSLTQLLIYCQDWLLMFLAVLKVKEVIIIPTQSFFASIFPIQYCKCTASRYTITPRPIIVYCFTITPRPQSIHFPGAFKTRKMIPNYRQKICLHIEQYESALHEKRYLLLLYTFNVPTQYTFWTLPIALKWRLCGSLRTSWYYFTSFWRKWLDRHSTAFNITMKV